MFHCSEAEGPGGFDLRPWRWASERIRGGDGRQKDKAAVAAVAASAPHQYTRKHRRRRRRAAAAAAARKSINGGRMNIWWPGRGPLC